MDPHLPQFTSSKNHHQSQFELGPQVHHVSSDTGETPEADQEGGGRMDIKDRAV